MCIFRVNLDIVNLDNPALKQGSPRSTVAAQFYRLILNEITEIVRQTIGDSSIKSALSPPSNDPHISIAQSTG
jgi:hypothetical protein